MTRNPACAICGCDTRPLRFSEWDGRMVAACKPCLAQAKTPGREETSAEKVFRFVSQIPGSTAGEICEGMGLADDGVDEAQDKQRTIVYQWLSRLARRGALRTEGGRTARLYYVADASLVPEKSQATAHNAKPRVTKRPEEVLVKVRAYRARLRDRRMAAGLCVKCGKPKGEETKQQCRECKDRHRDDNWIYRNTKRGRKKTIRALRRYYQRNVEAQCEQKRARYWERKIAGICNSCGANPCAEDSVRCETCTEVAREASRKTMKRLRAERAAAGKCLRCGKRSPVLGGISCKACRKQVLKWKAHRERRK